VVDYILCRPNKIMFIRTRRLSNAFRQFTVYIRKNIICELFRLVEKIKQGKRKRKGKGRKGKVEGEKESKGKGEG